MKKLLALGITLLLTFAFVVAGCGSSPSGGSNGSGGGTSAASTIDMDATNFTTHSITVKANTPITLDNTVGGGGFHILCIGTGNGGTGPSDCDKSGNGPSQLYGDGMTIQAGQKPTVTFPNTGVYHVICTVHPGMHIDVTVQ